MAIRVTARITTITTAIITRTSKSFLLGPAVFSEGFSAKNSSFFGTISTKGTICFSTDSISKTILKDSLFSTTTPVSHVLLYFILSDENRTLL